MIYVVNMDEDWKYPINIIDKFKSLEEFCNNPKYSIYDAKKIGYPFWNHTDKGRIRVYNTKPIMGKMNLPNFEVLKKLDRDMKLNKLLS